MPDGRKRKSRVTVIWTIKKGSKCITKTFRIPEEICIPMETLATKNNISLNQLVVQSLEYAMSNLEQEKR